MDTYRPIPEFPEYEASANGVIRRSVAARTSPAGKVLSTFRNRQGYEVTTLRRNGRSIKRLVSRLVCSAFHGPSPFEGAQVNHLNGVIDDNRPSNLEWTTATENIRHARDVLGVSFKAKAPWKHTPPEFVRAIRASNDQPNALAALYGVSRQTVRRIQLGETRSDV